MPGEQEKPVRLSGSDMLAIGVLVLALALLAA
jgi:hypothetical protein